ncbi:FAD-dependent oxidoreductase [Endozoicomonas euniceicola]|uniref:NAD(P)-binding protein n=1 Tax=Endozoicomonas euniceicola TaxID=1234143 RepID=A0ABY6H015_9GAMM|nr:FAD-dependent oxidoreductase [Endozoicomonas euniceicola]UYM17626.1 NAD(P)-binding protein [Endozoicomonas euniceicola]
MIYPLSALSTTDNIGIIGAGAAGIFTAYEVEKKFPGDFKIDIYDQGKEIGGHVSSTNVTYGGKEYTLDAGAQFFSHKAQPAYDELIEEAGLIDKVKAYPAGLTIWNSETQKHLFWVPSTYPGFVKYSLQDWKRIVEFGFFLVAAERFNTKIPPDWLMTVDDFLDGLDFVSTDFKKNVLKNLFSQFVLMPYDQIGKASALFAITYFIQNAFGPKAKSKDAIKFSTAVFNVNQSEIGLLGILEKVLEKSKAEKHTDLQAIRVAPEQEGIKLHFADKTTKLVKQVVLAGSPASSAELLKDSVVDPELKTLLKDLASQYTEITITLQKDTPCWMPHDPTQWSAANTLVNESAKKLTFSGWMGSLSPPYDKDQLIPVFKSWGFPDLPDKPCAHIFHTLRHDIMQPTVEFMKLREQLNQWQGKYGIFYAGGWTNWFDSQESALRSAKAIAAAIKPQVPEITQAASSTDKVYGRSEQTSGRSDQAAKWLSHLASYLDDSLQNQKNTLQQIIECAEKPDCDLSKLQPLHDDL